jgi:nucleoside-diphosphate-sugar epimerase
MTEVTTRPVGEWKFDEAVTDAFDDMLQRMPDLAKVRRLIGFQPRYSLDDTLAQVIEYEKGRKA